MRLSTTAARWVATMQRYYHDDAVRQVVAWADEERERRQGRMVTRVDLEMALDAHTCQCPDCRYGDGCEQQREEPTP